MQNDRLINTSVDYERTGVNLRALKWFAVSSIIAAIVLVFAHYLLYRVWSIYGVPFLGDQVLLNQQLNFSAHQPGLIVEPGRDATLYRKSAQELLQDYGWVNRSEGIAHVPIDVAAAELLARGLPQQQASTSPTPMPTPAVRKEKE